MVLTSTILRSRCSREYPNDRAIAMTHVLNLFSERIGLLQFRSTGRRGYEGSRHDGAQIVILRRLLQRTVNF
uniref:Uncharacterized protein n=1 Tax=Agrobacterium genomosp. 6 TaxID=1183411 RepID=A0A2Z2PDH8_9HYPH|nr:hypothetical protein [Agrobacterium genomosp. 6]ASK42399.1 hypothetical protein [Agrobacterium sp.]